MNGVSESVATPFADILARVGDNERTPYMTFDVLVTVPELNPFLSHLTGVVNFYFLFHVLRSTWYSPMDLSALLWQKNGGQLAKYDGLPRMSLCKLFLQRLKKYRFQDTVSSQYEFTKIYKRFTTLARPAIPHGFKKTGNRAFFSLLERCYAIGRSTHRDMVDLRMFGKALWYMEILAIQFGCHKGHSDIRSAQVQSPELRPALGQSCLAYSRKLLTSFNAATLSRGISLENG